MMILGGMIGARLAEDATTAQANPSSLEFSPPLYSSKGRF